MTVQNEVLRLSETLTDESMQIVLELMRMLPKKEPASASDHRYVLGLAEGRKLCSEGYDLDAEDSSVLDLFEGYL